MKIYYAHHMYKYNTLIEKYEIELIKKSLPEYEIINPNGSIDPQKSEQEIMNDCFDLIDNSSTLVFSSMNGVVGKGVHDEVDHAIETKKDIYYISDNKLVEIDSIKWNVINESHRIYATLKFNKNESRKIK